MFDIRPAIQAIRAGQVVLIPTDTVYGLAVGCCFGVDRLRQLKGGRGKKNFVIMTSSTDQLSALNVSLNRFARALLVSPWVPGPLTLVLPRLPEKGHWLGERNEVAIRLPADQLAMRLLQATGWLYVTSANRSDQPTETTPEQIIPTLDADLIGAVIDDGRRERVASTVVACKGQDWQILRQGEVSQEQLSDYLKANARPAA